MAPAATAGLVTLLVVLMGGVVLSIGQTNPVASGQDTPTDPATTGLPRSEPEVLVIPAMKLRTRLTQLGLDDNQLMELPGPKRAGWYTQSVTPGQRGVTVIAGYIRRSTGKPGVFARLLGLHQDDQISVRREDGTVVVYQVTDITNYPKGKFPADRVYASSGQPVLRLITTGGTLRPNDRPGNVVVSADFVESR